VACPPKYSRPPKFRRNLGGWRRKFLAGWTSYSLRPRSRTLRVHFGAAP